MASLEKLDRYPARRLFEMYMHQGVYVKYSTPSWSHSKTITAL